MKNIFRVMFLGLLMAGVACTELGPETINEINDHYTVPEDAVTLSTLAGSESVWSGDRRLFNLSFTGDGGKLETTLIGFDAILSTGQYVLTDAETAKVGDAINTKVDGRPATSGYVLVGKKASDYQITAVVVSGSVQRVLSWTGSLPFKADPAPTLLSQVISAQSNVNNGTNSVTMNLGTVGISQEFDMSTYQTVWHGQGNYLALDLYSEDGYLHEGTYVPCAEGGVINEGEFGIGYDGVLDMGEWGTYPFENWGTCWWTVSGGTATAEKITSGIVTVTRTEDGWKIAWGSKYPQEVVFNGPIPALTKSSGGNGGGGGAAIEYTYTIGELQYCILSDNTTIVDGVMKNPVLIMDKNGEQVANIELVLATGATELEGEYVSTEYAHEPGQLANGYYLDFSSFGWGIIEGGSWYMNGTEKVYIDPGQVVTVKKIATGAYEFIGTGFDYAAAGPDYVPGDNPGGGDEPEDDGSDLSGVTLILNSGLTYTMEDQTASNTSADGSALSGVTLWRVNVKQGSNLVANFDFVVSAGKEDLAGTYTVMSYPDAAGKAGNGWGFAAWNMFGGCYYIVDGKYYFIPVDATVKVSAKSDGTLKIKFSGAIQNEDYTDGGQGGVLLDNIAKG